MMKRALLALVGIIVWPPLLITGETQYMSDQDFAIALEISRVNILKHHKPIVLQTHKSIRNETLLASAKAVAEKIVLEPEGLEDLFDDFFLRQVPIEELRGIFKQYYAQYGPVVSVTLLSQDSETAGKFKFTFEKNVWIPTTITVTSARPHKVIGLFFASPVGGYKSVVEIMEEMQKLPGQISFMLTELGKQSSTPYTINPDVSLAIGSTFKLYILAALVEEKISWSEILSVKEELKSLPSGNLHTWPEGSPITIHTLATKMISESDNTATDHLLYRVGRERIESLLRKLGNTQPERSVPFLSTLEVFKLKSQPEVMKKYLNADSEARRKMLDGEMPAIPRDKIQPPTRPIAINSIEWFASASDLCRLMDDFDRKNDAVSLKILAINPGVDIPKDKFSYVGFKGGSEPGVLNLTWLLKNKNGVSYCLSAGWNNPSDELDGSGFISLVQSIIYLIP